MQYHLDRVWLATPSFYWEWSQTLPMHDRKTYNGRLSVSCWACTCTFLKECGIILTETTTKVSRHSNKGFEHPPGSLENYYWRLLRERKIRLCCKTWSYICWCSSSLETCKHLHTVFHDSLLVSVNNLFPTYWNKSWPKVLHTSVYSLIWYFVDMSSHKINVII